MTEPTNEPTTDRFRPHSPGERAARAFPAPNGLIGVGVIVLDGRDRVLLGLGHDGRWELPGGKVDPGEGFEQAGVRELAEETGLRADAADVRILAVLTDGRGGVARLTAAALAGRAEGTPEVTEPDKIMRWEWFSSEEIPQAEALFGPSAAVLALWRPELGLPRPAGHCYPVG